MPARLIPRATRVVLLETIVNVRTLLQGCTLAQVLPTPMYHTPRLSTKKVYPAHGWSATKNSALDVGVMVGCVGMVYLRYTTTRHAP